MKRAVLILSFLPAVAIAKVSDFDALIKENAATQKELQHNINNDINSNKAALGAENDHRIVLDSASYNAPTSRKTLKFKKEISQRHVSDKKEMQRIANELKSVERDL